MTFAFKLEQGRGRGKNAIYQVLDTENFIFLISRLIRYSLSTRLLIVTTVVMFSSQEQERADIVGDLEIPNCAVLQDKENKNRRQSISAGMLQIAADAKTEEEKQRRQSIWPDIDAGDFENPHAVPMYVKDIYAAYREQEADFAPNKDYMHIQTNLRPKYRAILVDWLGSVCYHHKLQKETYFLSVNILDRFLSEAKIEKKNLQLVGIASLLIASKYEEIQHPTLNDLMKSSAYLYSTLQIKLAEKQILCKFVPKLYSRKEYMKISQVTVPSLDL
eukprot:TRINITY_DN57_c0_g1_i11.p2 TRINITY_DN57_c0_g1~~TRINITY_DN57_c0_g1_i11.p2  ORF type:complete len:275 (-),score=27.63 TRINITY_DN57_c0_g1_i11:1036-1860(-)